MSHNDTQQEPGSRRHSHLAHVWVMLMCVPMVVIVIALVATGGIGAGFILAAVMCVAMIAMMMRMMSGGGERR